MRPRRGSPADPVPWQPPRWGGPGTATGTAVEGLDAVVSPHGVVEVGHCRRVRAEVGEQLVVDVGHGVRGRVPDGVEAGHVDVLFRYRERERREVLVVAAGAGHRDRGELQVTGGCGHDDVAVGAVDLPAEVRAAGQPGPVVEARDHPVRERAGRGHLVRRRGGDVLAGVRVGRLEPSRRLDDP